MRLFLALPVLLVACLTWPLPASAASVQGTYDSSYGVGGKAVLPDGRTWDRITIATRSDGRTYVINTGFDEKTRTYTPTIVTLVDTTGHFEPAFGMGGVVELGAGHGQLRSPPQLDKRGVLYIHDQGYDATGAAHTFLTRVDERGVAATVPVSVVQPSSFRLAGDALLVASQQTVSRYVLATGDLDPSFGVGGTYTLTQPTTDARQYFGSTVDVDAVGRIYVTADCDFNEFWMERLTAGGMHDPSFSTPADASCDPKTRSISYHSGFGAISAVQSRFGDGHHLIVGVARYITMKGTSSGFDIGWRTIGDDGARGLISRAGSDGATGALIADGPNTYLPITRDYVNHDFGSGNTTEVRRFGSDDELDASWGVAGAAAPPYALGLPSREGDTFVPVINDGLRRIRTNGEPDVVAPKLRIARDDRCRPDSTCVNVLRSGRISWAASDNTPGVRVEVVGRDARLMQAKGSISWKLPRRGTCLYLRAVDVVGRTSSWQRRCELGLRGATGKGTTGRWIRITDAAAAGGYLLVSRSAGQTMPVPQPFTSYASEVRIVATTCPRCGSIRFRAPYTRDVIVSLRRPTYTKFDQLVVRRSAFNATVTTVGTGLVAIDGFHITASSRPTPASP